MNKQYYWIVAYLEQQPYLIGGSLSDNLGGDSQEQARTKAFGMGLVNFKIASFPTRNLQAASAYFRGKRLEQTKDLRTASNRIRHKIHRKRRH